MAPPASATVRHLRSGVIGECWSGPARKPDHRWRVALLTEHFDSALVVGHGVVYDAAALPGLVCIDSAGHRAGALRYRIADGQLEVVSIDAKTHRQGTGTKR